MKIFKALKFFIKGKDEVLSSNIKNTPEHYLGILRDRKEKLDKMTNQRDTLAGKVTTQKALEEESVLKINEFTKAAKYAKEHPENMNTDAELNELLKELFDAIVIEKSKLSGIRDQLNVLEPLYNQIDNIVETTKRRYNQDKQKVDNVIEKMKLNKELGELFDGTGFASFDMDELKEIEINIEDIFNTNNIKVARITEENKTEDIMAKIKKDQSFEDWVETIK